MSIMCSPLVETECTVSKNKSSQNNCYDLTVVPNDQNTHSTSCCCCYQFSKLIIVFSLKLWLDNFQAAEKFVDFFFFNKWYMKNQYFFTIFFSVFLVLNSLSHAIKTEQFYFAPLRLKQGFPTAYHRWCNVTPPMG